MADLYRAVLRRRRVRKLKGAPSRVRKLKPGERAPLLRKPQVASRGGGLNNQKRVL